VGALHHAGKNVTSNVSGHTHLAIAATDPHRTAMLPS